MTEQSSLSIVIVNYNTGRLLTECIESIVTTGPPGPRCEIVVVDNGSTDDSASLAGARYPQVEVVFSGTNLGFSRANNRGVELTSGTYVLFLNPDVVVRPGTLAYMVSWMDAHDDVGAASCYVELPDGSLDDAAHRGFPTPWRSFCHFSGLSRLAPRSRLLGGYSMAWALSARPHEVDAVAGCFMMVRRAAGEPLGWWDEDYFFYGEDLDLCFRLKQSGWKVCFVPEVSIFHYKGMSSGIKKVSRDRSRANRETRLASTRARFQAMRIFYEKNYVDRYPLLMRKLVFAGIRAKEWHALAGHRGRR